MALVASLVLTIKASNDPTHDESVSENPTGRAAVHGHPKVAAGSSSYRQAPPPYPSKPLKYNSEPHYHDTYEDSNDVSDYYKDEYHSSEKDETPLMSSEAASEEHPMPPVMTEDNAMMLSEELTNALESNEAMIEEVSEHDEINGEATARDPQQFCANVDTLHVNICNCPVCICQCDPDTFDNFGRGNCNSLQDGKEWCFLKERSFCMDQKLSNQVQGRFWSNVACSLKRRLSEVRNFPLNDD